MRLASAATAILLMVLLIVLSDTTQAQQWRVGVAYASGLGDVTDLYEDNLRLAGFEADVDLKVPVGIAAGFSYEWASGARGDIGLGPAFLIGGDVEHFEIPLSATIGYNFLRRSDFSPYVRAGLVHHFVSGDLYSSSSPGFLAAIGIDFRYVTLELGGDLSEVEFDSLACDSAGQECALTTTELNTYDFVVGFFWRFR